MDTALLDNLVFFFALVFYAFLFVVYILRARELSNLEFKLRTWKYSVGIQNDHA